MDNLKRIGDNIRYYREKQSIDRKELASFLCITSSLVAKWEEGKRSPKKYIDEIAKILNVNSDILEHEEHVNYIRKSKIYQGFIFHSIMFGIIFLLISIFYYFNNIVTIENINLIEEDEENKIISSYEIYLLILSIAFIMNVIISIILKLKR